MVLCVHRPIRIKCYGLKSTCGLKKWDGDRRKCSYVISLSIYSAVIIRLKCFV